MSGPKISVYELSGWGKKIVFGQMRCEQQSVLCAQQIQELIHQALAYSGELQKQMSLLDIFERRGESVSGQREELLKLLKRLETETEQVRSTLRANMPQISAKYRITEEALEEKKQELAKLRALRKQIQKLREDIDEAVGNANDAGSVVPESIQHSIAEDLGGYVSFDLPPEDDIPDTSFEDSKAGLQNELTVLLRDPELSPEIIAEIKKAIISLDKIHQIEYLHSFDSVTVKNIFKKIDAYKYELEKKQAEFNEAYSRYKMLCSMAKETAATFEYSDEAFAEMEEEIERLEIAIVRMQEQDYVSECVDQVMTEMGYDLIGSREVVKKKTGKRFRNELFTFNEGTAVNVTYSSDGQISMELGGIAREDRIPSPEETEMLTQDMQTFCGEFAEFERRLKAKGVVINRRIALSPPSAEYAAIINVSDYDVSEGTQITEMKSVDRKKKAAEKKVMRRTE